MPLAPRLVNARGPHLYTAHTPIPYSMQAAYDYLYLLRFFFVSRTEILSHYHDLANYCAVPL